MRKDKIDPILQTMIAAAKNFEVRAVWLRALDAPGDPNVASDIELYESLCQRLTDGVGELERIMGECAVQVQVHQEMATASRMGVLRLEDKLAHAKARWNYWKMKCCDRGIPGTDQV